MTARRYDQTYAPATPSLPRGDRAAAEAAAVEFYASREFRVVIDLNGTETPFHGATLREVVDKAHMWLEGEVDKIEGSRAGRADLSQDERDIFDRARQRGVEGAAR